MSCFREDIMKMWSTRSWVQQQQATLGVPRNVVWECVIVEKDEVKNEEQFYLDKIMVRFQKTDRWVSQCMAERANESLPLTKTFIHLNLSQGS